MAFMTGKTTSADSAEIEQTVSGLPKSDLVRLVRREHRLAWMGKISFPSLYYEQDSQRVVDNIDRVLHWFGVLRLPHDHWTDKLVDVAGSWTHEEPTSDEVAEYGAAWKANGRSAGATLVNLVLNSLEIGDYDDGTSEATLTFQDGNKPPFSFQGIGNFWTKCTYRAAPGVAGPADYQEFSEDESEHYVSLGLLVPDSSAIEWEVEFSLGSGGDRHRQQA